MDIQLLRHPNIPKPLHGLNPRAIKGKEWWDVERVKAYKQQDYHCHACGVHKSEAKYHKWLEAHEFYDIDYELGRVTFKSLVALCHSCHNYIHDGRMAMLVNKGQFPYSKYRDIIHHGNSLLGFEWKLLFSSPNPPYVPDNTKVAEWNKWHLLFEGKTYYTTFKDFSHWQDFYSSKDVDAI